VGESTRKKEKSKAICVGKGRGGWVSQQWKPLGQPGEGDSGRTHTNP